MWIDYSSNEIDAPMSSWLYPLMGIWPFDKKARTGGWRLAVRVPADAL
jgi:hypothetical protein